MSDEQDDNHGIIGWILGLAVTIAIAVAFWAGYLGAFGGDSGKAPEPVAAAAPVVAAPEVAAPEVAAPAPVTSAPPVVAAVQTPSPAAIPGSPAAAKIYFEVGSFATPSSANQAVAELVAYSKSSSNAKLSISGFHDKTGDFAQNQELAKNRAKVVKDLLLSAGVPEDRVMLQKPVETMGGSDNKEARRVEVIAIQ